MQACTSEWLVLANLYLLSFQSTFRISQCNQQACLTADSMPVEIVQFCWEYNLDRLQNLPEAAGLKEAKLRMDGDKPYVTDNSNYIVDLYFETPIKDAKALAKAISELCGVVDHGLFLDMVDVVIIAGSNGIEVKKR